MREGRGAAAWAWPAAVLLVLLGTASVLLWMGRVPICACGMVELWHGAVQSAENSQHLTDWYTPSHVVHGFLFYALLSPLAPRLSFGARAVVATAVEAAWEIVENTDAVIRHYREATISLDYFGDSVLNSSADILAMLLGFWLASRLPVPANGRAGVGHGALRRLDDLRQPDAERADAALAAGVLARLAGRRMRKALPCPGVVALPREAWLTLFVPVRLSPAWREWP